MWLRSSGLKLQNVKNTKTIIALKMTGTGIHLGPGWKKCENWTNFLLLKLNTKVKWFTYFPNDIRYNITDGDEYVEGCKSYYVVEPGNGYEIGKVLIESFNV